MNGLKRIRAAWNVLTKANAQAGLPQGGSLVSGADQGTFGLAQRGSPEAMMREYRGWVFKCASIRAEKVAFANRRVLQAPANAVDDATEVAPTHPLAALLRNPNPMDTGMQLIERAQLHLDLTGNAYILMMPNASLSNIIEMWMLDPRYVRILTAKTGMIRSYEYRAGNRKWEIPPELIIHAKYPNPVNDYYGASPLMAIATEIDIDVESKAHQYHWLKNGILPPMAIEFEGFLNESVLKQLRGALKRDHTGKQAGTALIVPQGGKVQTLGLREMELNYGQSRKDVRDEITSAFRVPKILIGITEDVNYASADAARAVFAEDTITPLLTRWDSILTERLAPYFGDGLIVRHDSIIPRNRAEDRQDMQVMLQNGVTSINEEREARGWQPVEGGEKPTINRGRTPIDQLAEQGATLSLSTEEWERRYAPPLFTRSMTPQQIRAAEDETRGRFERLTDPMIDDWIDTLVAFFDEQARDVLSRLPAENGYQDWLSKHWDASTKQLEIEGVLFDEALWNETLVELGLDQWVEHVPDAWRYALELIGDGSDVELNREAIRTILKPALEKIKEVNTTTLNALRDTLTEGVAGNESIAELEDRITGVYEDAQGYRATRIARTSANQGSNASIIRAWIDSGIVDKKGWLDARDESVRETHSAASGQEVALNSAFIVGGSEMQFPGDPNGAAEEVIACRCSMYPVLKEDA